MSLRTAIDVLFNRVELLTDLANKNGIPIPPLDDYEQSILEQVCATLELPRERILPQGQAGDPQMSQLDSTGTSDTLLESMAPYDDSLVYAAMPVDHQADLNMSYDFQTWADFSTMGPWEESPSDWPWQILNNPTVGMNLPQELPPSNGSSDDEGDTSIVPHLAARFGSLCLSHDGSLRYYGTASNHHFLGKPLHRDLDHKAHDIDQECAIALENALLDQIVPLDLQEHLIDLFFKWHNTSHCTVDRASFEDAHEQEVGQKSAFRSQALVAVMYVSCFGLQGLRLIV